MRILENIIKRLEGLDPDKDYFDYTNKERHLIVSTLWDEVYGEYYIKSLMGLTQDNPLKIQFDILTYLIDILNDYERDQEFELCDIVLRLIQITEIKIQNIDDNYANSK